MKEIVEKQKVNVKGKVAQGGVSHEGCEKKRIKNRSRRRRLKLGRKREAVLRLLPGQDQELVYRGLEAAQQATPHGYQWSRCKTGRS